MPITEVDFERDDPNEFTVVEQPLLTQLVGMGWDYIAGDLEYPAKTFRTSFRETVLEPRLKAAIKRINKDDHGNEWLDDLTIERAVRELLKPDGRGLLELNRNFTQRLQRGVRVTVAEGARSGEEITVHAIAWDKDRLVDNDFLAINQFQVLIKGTPYNKRPDIVLFVSGLPLVVIECKSPAITSPMEAAVDQLLHYSNQRDLDHAEREGIPELFHFNALVVGTHFYQACASTLGDTGEYFAEWKDTSPIPEADVLRELGKPSGSLSSQEKLVAGMLRPAHLLDLMRNFTVWDVQTIFRSRNARDGLYITMDVGAGTVDMNAFHRNTGQHLASHATLPRNRVLRYYAASVQPLGVHNLNDPHHAVNLTDADDLARGVKQAIWTLYLRALQFQPNLGTEAGHRTWDRATLLLFGGGASHWVYPMAYRQGLEYAGINNPQIARLPTPEHLDYPLETDVGRFFVAYGMSFPKFNLDEVQLPHELRTFNELFPPETGKPNRDEADGMCRAAGCNHRAVPGEFYCYDHL